MTTANQHYVTIYYTVGDDDFDDYLSLEIDGRYLDGIWSDMVAADCAKDYYHDHDGWELDWSSPVRFTLWRDVETKIGSFDIHMELTPSFNAYAEEPTP